jgi:hypothetical protein
LQKSLPKQGEFMLSTIKSYGRTACGAVWNQINDHEKGRAIGLAMAILGGAIFKELCVWDKTPFSKASTPMMTAKTIAIASTVFGFIIWRRAVLLPPYFLRPNQN